MAAATSDKQTANKLICGVIGDLGGTKLFGCPQGAKETPLGKVLKGFCLAVSSVAVLFLIWEVFSGMIASANEGEFLGKRTHTSWAITRTVVGGLSLIPAFGGFCLAQLVMLWATAVGIGIAGGTLGKISVVPEIIYSAPPSLVKGQEVVDRIGSGVTCVSEWRAHVDKLTADGIDDPSKDMVWGVQPRQVGNSLEMQFGELKGTDPQYHATSCGVARFSYADGITGDAGADSIGRSLAITMAREIQTLTNTVLDATDGVVRNGESHDSANMTITAAVALFDSNMADAAKSAAERATTTVNKTDVDHVDWIKFGYQDVNKLITNIKTARAANVETNNTQPQQQSPDAKGGYTPATGVKATYYGVSAEELRTPEGRAKAEANKKAWTEANNGQESAQKRKDLLKERLEELNPFNMFENMMKKSVLSLGKTVASNLKEAAASQGGSPLRFLIDLGSELAGWGITIIVAYAGIATAITLMMILAPPAVGGAVGGVLAWLGTMVLAVLVPITFFGIKLAAYLPFLTAIIWTGAILNWLVIVVEAMFAAPLWAMVHLDLDGDSYNTQRTGHGYVFLLNLLFRPVIMVGCLFFAQAAINACFGLFLGHVAGTINHLAPENSWWSNLLLIIGAVWVTIIFAEQIITQGMGAIFQIPDKVFTWIGGQFGSNVGVSMGDSTSGAINQSAGTMGRAGGALGEGAMGGVRGAQSMGKSIHDSKAKKSQDATATREKNAADEIATSRHNEMISAIKSRRGGGGGTIRPSAGGGAK